METQNQQFPLHMVDQGAGTPVLLIHGFPFNARMWEPQLGPLKKQARLLAPDLPGFGDSPPVDGSGSVKAYAEECAALLEALGILESVVIVGLSMGGYIALAFARQFPERVGGLILASTRAGADSEEVRQSRDKTIAQIREEGIQPLVEAMFPKLLAPQTYDEQPAVAARLKEIMLESTPAGMIAALEAMRERPDSTQLLPILKVPILIIHGQEDRVIPPSEAHTMAAAIPVAQMEILPKAGHLPNMEQAEAFNRIVSEFLSKI